MKYKALSSSDIDDLNGAVNRHIKDGWIPFGSISMTSCCLAAHATVYVFYAQAIIQYENTEPVNTIELPV